jgi:hypothetical protein
MAEEAKRIAKDLWNYFNQKQWEDARMLLANDFEAHWPQTREKIVGPDKFIELNRIYPGQHNIAVQNIHSICSSEEYASTVITETKIESRMPDGKFIELLAVSFFIINDENQILSATEYWADFGVPPKWRWHLIEKY